MRRVCYALLAMIASSPVCAETIKSVITASNGVNVTVYSDDFADRYEYTAPIINFPDGLVLVATVKKAGKAPSPHLTGSFVYSGDWRRYSSALFRGGDPVTFAETGRDVGRCSSSRYSRPSCTMTEGFKIELTQDELTKHVKDGTVAIQIRAQNANTTIIEVPVSYIDAVSEMAR